MAFGFGFCRRKKPGNYTPSPSPLLILSDPVSHAEGNSGTTSYVWTLTLYRDGSTAAYPFSWAVTGTGANPADAADFGGVLPSGSGTFATGQTTKTITIAVTGDTTPEADETFLLTVTAAGLNSPTSIGTIVNDDAGPAPSLSLSSAVTHAEGNSGTTAFVWTLTLNRDGSTSSFPYSWAVTGTGSNPANAADFGGAFPSGSGTFATGETSKTISVLVSGDTDVETDETFLLTVTASGLNTVTSTGTITNDDSAGGTIAAPVITQTSAGGTAPFTWRMDDDASFFPGYYMEVNRATSLANLTAGTPILNGQAIQQIQPGDLAGDDIVFSDLSATPSGPLYLRMRVGSEDGLGGYSWGPWSNVLNDTIAAIVALATTNGSDKSQYINATGTPALTATMNNDLGAPCNVRAAVASAHKSHFEVTINSWSSQSNNFSIGLSDAGLVLGPAVYPRPGAASTAGASINIAHGSDAANLYANGGYVNDYYMPSAPQVGDIIVVEFDPAANTVSFWHRRSTTNTLLVTVTLTSGIPTNWTATVAGYGSSGGNGPDSMTCNFAGPFAKTPTSGYTAYG